MWSMLLDRQALATAWLEDAEDPQVGPDEVLLRVDRVGVTANNVTYAVLGDSYRYWEFFPHAGGGVVPVWGFADVVSSQAAGVDVGTRVYGYLPAASHLLVRPDRVSAAGFRDASPHRSALPSPYNSYVNAHADAAYSRETEDLIVLYRPLFYTSWMLADRLVSDEIEPGATVVLSSASSKTAYATAFCLRGQDLRIVGLTSPGNLAFVESLDVYDDVLGYSEVSRLRATPSVYVDFAGDARTRTAVRDQLGELLLADLVVGLTHQEPAAAGALSGPRPSVFFAPDQMARRVRDWGRAEIDRRFAAAWREFVPFAASSVDVVHARGAESLRRVWLDVLAGRRSPRLGDVVLLHG